LWQSETPTHKIQATLKPMLGKAEGNFTDELERLSDLHKSGMLTAEEFQKAKARLLG